jgi:ankyrin repeat protein
VLLAKRANVHSLRSGQWGEFARTPLHDVAATRHTDIAGLLLDYGANINAKENRHRTPLHRAVSSRNCIMVEFLISKRAEVNAVADWDPSPHVSYVLCPDRWMTPLHIAARQGYTEIVRALIAAGAARDIRVVRTDDGYRGFLGLTAFDLARRFQEQVANDCDELVKLLESKEIPNHE